MRYHWCKNSGRSSLLLLSTVVLIDYLATSVAAESTAVVNTTTGPVQGEIRTSVNSVRYATFKGMRYAKPPLGYLRFKPPVAIDPWTDILNATVDGDDCIQSNAFTRTIEGTEDCLFISVYTPVTDLKKTPTNLKSVMVWIYGGAFAFGSSSNERYHPDYLLEKDVVYVAFNYRLGSLGFLSLNHANATGNAGLKDQVLALKWIKANIDKFGGNPNNITIFGQSAGAASVGYHTLSDASKGLFHGAISMSGVPLNPWAFLIPAQALARAKQLAAVLGTISNDKEALLKTLYHATAVELVQGVSKIPLGFLSFVPTLEDETIATDVFLTKCSIDKYNTGNFTKVPQILGFADQEMISFVAAIKPILINIITESLNTYGDYSLNVPNLLSLIDDLIETSRKVLNELGRPAVEAIVNITTDLIFKRQIDQTQKILATENEGKPVYYYHNSFYTNTSLHNIILNSTLLGAGHTDDLAYIFHYPQSNYSTDPSDPVRRTIDRVTTMWTNFAKYGNPTPLWVRDNFVKVTWPNSGVLGRYLDIGTELKVGPRPTGRNTKLKETVNWPLLRSLNGCQ